MTNGAEAAKRHIIKSSRMEHDIVAANFSINNSGAGSHTQYHTHFYSHHFATVICCMIFFFNDIFVSVALYYIIILSNSMSINIVLVSRSPTLAPDARGGAAQSYIYPSYCLGKHRNASANGDFIALVSGLTNWVCG